MAKKLLSIILSIMMLLPMYPAMTAASQTSTNYALGKPYTTSVTMQSSFGNANTIVTDGNKYSTSYITDNGTSGGSPVSLTLDLKNSYTLYEIRLWHFWSDGRTFHNTKTEVSEDGTVWTTVFDSAVSGEYQESEQGKLIVFDPIKVRYIRDWINGSDKDNHNRWVEIQAYGPPQTGQDVKQSLPLKDSLESTTNITGLSHGTVTLTQDKTGGKHAVQVKAGDNTVQDWVYYNLTTSDPFNISEYNQVKLWVKPQAGAKWVEFWTKDTTNNADNLIKNDKNADGKYEVGLDLISGKWNEVTLDLTKTSSLNMVQAKDLWVRTNDSSTWNYDEITSVYSPVYNLDLTKMVNSKTQLVNGELQFKPGGGANTYDTTPTILTSQKQSNFNRTDTTQADFQTGTADGVVANNNGALELQKAQGGSNYLSTVTATADFSGTHNNTVAVNNSVQLNDTIDSYTKLLLHNDGTTFTDSATGKTITAYGNAAISTTQSKFGGASAYFDGNGDYLQLADSDDLTWNGDFTIDFWVNFSFVPTTSGTAATLIESGDGSPPGFFRFNYHGTQGWIVGSSLFNAGFTPTTNNWYHIALVRVNGVFKLFKDGTKIGNDINDSTVFDTGSGGLFIGSLWNKEPNLYLNGYMDEIHISKGIARWTSNFTPPTSPYGDYLSSGTYTHSIQDVSEGGVANNFTISYSKTTPDNTSLSVEVRTSLDGGTTWGDWAAKNSGDIIIPNGTNLSNYRVQWRANLSTTDTTITPSLDEVIVSNGQNYISSGTYTSPEINILLPGSASGSAIGWNSQDAVVGGNVVSTILVETSLSTDGTTWGDWQTATNGGAIPGITSSTDLSAAKLKYRVSLTTSDITVSPLLNDISFFINIEGNNDPVLLPNGKISGININSSYATATGTLNELASKRVYLSGVSPDTMGLSGDGTTLLYKNPQDGNKLYLLDLLTGANTSVSNTAPAKIQVNHDGSKAAFKDSGNTLYLYDRATNTVTTVSSSVGNFELQKDGALFYNVSSTTYRLDTGASAPGTSILTSYTVSYLGAPDSGNQAYLSVAAQVYSLDLTPAGWRAYHLTTAAKTIDGLWTNPAGDLVFFKTADGWYSYHVATKSIRKLDVTAANLVRVTETNKLAVLGVNNEYNLYDPNTDKVTGIRPADASGTVFDVDSTGNKMTYVASAGLATSYHSGTQRPERYLLSFNDDNNWYSYKTGKWETVKSGSVPAASDFLENGMTINEINALTADDFSELYADGREIYSLDVSIYFASPDPYTTPSLKGIVVLMKGNLSAGDLEETPLASLLYTKKQQDFNAAGWRQIKKIYSVELYPKNAETYYFITTDGSTYKSYKNRQWVTVDPSLFTNLEQKWIDITLQGMTATELRAVPEVFLSMLLPVDNFSVVYVQKVQDATTEGYTSRIEIDYAAAEFNSANLVIKITLTDGTVKEYPNLTKAEVEDFMRWLSQRQYNKGPIFRKVVTGSTTPGVTQVNDYINYYLIQFVSVEEMQ